MAIDFPLTASQPFSITLPTTATVNDAGEVVVDLTANASQAEADAAAAQATADQAVLDAAAAQSTADQAVHDAAAAQATADDAVPKTDLVPIFSPRMSLINTATGTVYRMRAGFDGELVEAQIVIDGVTTAAGEASVAVEVNGAAAATDDPISVEAKSAANFGLNTLFTAPVAFTRYQTIAFTVTSDNTSATFGTVTLGARRV